MLGTSTAFALFTPWGFFRFRWVTLKWIALACLALGGVFVRTPAINALAAAVDVHGALVDATVRTQAIAAITIECVVLIALFALSAVKPWGRTKHKLEPPRFARIGIAVVVVLVGAAAAVQSMMLASLRATPIAAVEVRALPDGSYVGEATVGVRARVRVEVSERRIEHIDVLELPDSFYAQLARGVTTKIVRAQRIDVDGVTGATTTSRAVQKAVETAVTGGGAMP